MLRVRSNRVMPIEIAEAIDIDAGETTMLAEEIIPNVDCANDIFGRVLGDGSIPIVLMPGSCGCLPFLTVPEGCYAMIQRFGADYNDPLSNDIIWRPGFHFSPPWVRVSHLVTKQTFVFNTPVKGCKTADNVTVTIDVTLALRIMGDKEKGEDPELVRTFVYKLTPRGLTQQIKDAQEEAVRALARSVNHTVVYGLRSKTTESLSEAPKEGQDEDVLSALQADEDAKNVTEAMKRSLNSQFNKYGVQITDVMITNVRLPPDIVRQMQDKTTYASIIAEQKVSQKNELQLLGFKEEREMIMQQKREERMAEEAEGIRKAAEKKQELDTTEAETKRLLAELRETEKASIREILSKDNLAVQEIKSETWKTVEEIKSETQAIVSTIKSEMEVVKRQKGAEIARIKAEALATSQTILAVAEKDACVLLQKKREHELVLRQLDVMQSLAGNSDVVITGSQGRNGEASFLSDLLASQKQAQILLNVKAAK